MSLVTGRKWSLKYYVLLRMAIYTNLDLCCHASIPFMTNENFYAPKRKTLIALRDGGIISDEVLRKILCAIDGEEVRLPA